MARVRYYLAVPLFYVGEVAAFCAGIVLLLLLAIAAVALLAVAVARITVIGLYEEAAYLWRRVRGGAD